MSFGEKGLDIAAPRNATVICVTNCDLACVLKKDYDQLLKEMTKAQHSKIHDFFFIEVFKRSLSKAVVDNIGADFCKIMVTLPKGNIVFHQGGFDNKVYIIKQGIVQFEHSVVIDKKEKPEDYLKKGQYSKKLFTVCRLTTGEILGEESIYSNEPKQFTARVCSEFAVMYYVSTQCIKGYTKSLTLVEEFFSTTYKERKTSRDTLLTNLLIKDGIIHKEEIKIRPLRKVWAFKKPIEKNPISNFEDFDKKYHNEIADFVREKVPSRDPKLAMLKDFEHSLQQCIIPRADLDELQYLVSDEYKLKDRSHIELEEIKKNTRDPRRILKVKMARIAASMIKDKSTSSKIAENSSVRGSSLYTRLYDYPKTAKAKTTRECKSLNVSSMPNTTTATSFNFVAPRYRDLDPDGTERSLTLPSAYNKTNRSMRVTQNTGSSWIRIIPKPLDDFDEVPLQCKISPLLHKGSVSKTADLIRRCKLT